MKRSAFIILAVIVSVVALLLPGCAGSPGETGFQPSGSVIKDKTTGTATAVTPMTSDVPPDGNSAKNVITGCDEGKVRSAVGECFRTGNPDPYVLVIENRESYDALSGLIGQRPENSEVFKLSGDISDLSAQTAVDDTYFRDNYIVALMFKDSSGSWKYEKTYEKSDAGITLFTKRIEEYPATCDVGGFILGFSLPGHYDGEKIFLTASTN